MVAIRLTPRADRDALGGTATLSDGRIVVQARVRAPPSDGAANAALTVVVAAALRVPKSAVTIVGGATQRVKQVAIAGQPTELAALLNAVTAPMS